MLIRAGFSNGGFKLSRVESSKGLKKTWFDKFQVIIVGRGCYLLTGTSDSPSALRLVPIETSEVVIIEKACDT